MSQETCRLLGTGKKFPNHEDLIVPLLQESMSFHPRGEKAYFWRVPKMLLDRFWVLLPVGKRIFLLPRLQFADVIHLHTSGGEVPSLRIK